MSSGMNKEIEELLELLDKLKESSKLVIVEGLKDKRALEWLGFKSKNILRLKKPLYAVVEEASEITSARKGKAKECAILTDLDRKGRELYARLRKDLQKHRIKIDDTLRKFLFKSTKLRQIEGLKTYLENKQRLLSHQ